MAPEQAMAKDIGPWTDLYSTGVVAYELFAGVVPFHDTDTPMAILLRHVNDPVPSPTTINPKLDPRLVQRTSTVDTPAPLTPAPFHEDTGELQRQQEEEESGAFQTFHKGAKP